MDHPHPYPLVLEEKKFEELRREAKELGITISAVIKLKLQDKLKNQE